MKKNLLFIGLAVLAMAGCQKVEGPDKPETPETPVATVDKTIQVTGVEWTENDVVGVFTTADKNLEFKNSEAGFTGKIAADSKVIAAYYPYVAGEMAAANAFPVVIPAAVTAGDALPAFYAGAADESENVELKQMLSAIKVSFTNLDKFTYASEAVTSITVKAAKPFAGAFAADLTAQTLTAVQESVAEVAVSLAANTVLSADYSVEFAAAPVLNNGDEVEVALEVAGMNLTVKTVLAADMAAGQTAEVVVDGEQLNPSIKLAWSYKIGDGVKMEALHPAVDANGNIYLTQTGTNLLYKIGPDGKLVWKIAMEGADESTFDGQLSVASLEKDGSVVYAGGGSTAGTGAFYAFNTSDGSLKWDFNANEFWAASGTPKPSVNRVNAAIDEKYIYIGNGGTTGTAVVIDKATGERAAYVSSKADGTGGPAGGCNVGVSISKSGLALFRAGYGTFSFETSLVGGTDYVHETFGGFVPYSAQYRDGTLTTRNGNIACFTLNGKDYFTLFGATDAGMSVIWAPITTGADLAYYFTGNNDQTWTTHKIAGTQKQDQGGLVIGPRNEIIVALKHNTTVPGGVYAVDPATNTMAWKYEVGAEVGGTPAVDKAGNVHILDDFGMYYIVKPDYANKTATLIAKTSLFELYKETGHVFNEGDRCKAFTTPIIGPDGRMYNAVYFRDSAKAAILSAVMCLEYEGCKGYGDTPWPLKNADCFNSGHQLK